MARCLVTGSKGFIGSHLVPRLKKDGHTVLGFDLKDHQDIRDSTKIYNAIESCDVVYHLAALTDVSTSFLLPNEYYATNTMGTTNIVVACHQLQKKCIYASTAAVYDDSSSPYAQSKTLAEQMIKNHLDSSVVLRLFNVYGEGMNTTTMLSRFQNENPLTIYGDGTQTRDFIHVDDVVSIMVEAVKSEWNGFVGDVGTRQSYTVKSIADMFHKPIVYADKRKEVYESKANITKLRKLYKQSFVSLPEYIELWNTQH